MRVGVDAAPVVAMHMELYKRKKAQKLVHKLCVAVVKEWCRKETKKETYLIRLNSFRSGGAIGGELMVRSEGRFRHRLHLDKIRHMLMSVSSGLGAVDNGVGCGGGMVVIGGEL